jgi:hypothetical protein
MEQYDRKLIREEIKLSFPKATYTCYMENNDENKYVEVFDYSDKLISLEIQPFGEIIMDNTLNINIKYNNPFNTKFENFKEFFESRLKFEGGGKAYFYEDRITIFHRSPRTTNRFEASMEKAKIFKKVANTILEFIDYNK